MSLFKTNLHVWSASIVTTFLILLTLGCGSSVPSTYNLQGISPSQIEAGAGDFTLTLTGSNFTSETKVLFGTKTLSPATVSSKQLTVLVPAFATEKSGTVDVKASGASISNSLQFTITNPAPNILSISQSTGLYNNAALPLEITGSNFVPNSTVNIGALSLVPTSISPTRLSVVVPAGSFTATGTLPVTVTNPSPGGGTSSALSFAVVNPVPVLSTLSPISVLVDGPEFVLNIVGSGFAPGVTVNFGATSLTPSSVSWTQLTVPVPATAITASGVVSVTATNIAPGGGTSNSLEFTVENPLPTLSSLSPTSIDAGVSDFALNLTGTGFIAASKVNFGSVTLAPTSVSSTQMSVVIPAAEVVGGGLFQLTVANPGPGGGTSNAQTFTVINPVPVITALSQQSALSDSPAFPLEVTGTGFVPQSKVSFGGTELTPSSVTPTLLTVLVTQAAITAAGTGSISISVVNPAPGGGTSNLMNFTIQNPQPALTTLSPPSVTAEVADVVLTISGSHFVHGATVTAGSRMLTPLSVKSQSLTVSIPVDLLVAGTLPITAANPAPGGGPSNNLTLTVHAKASVSWITIANNTMQMPNSSQNFNSYNQPSINVNGTVVFKGQGKGSSGPTFGVYVHKLSGHGNQPTTVIADNSTVVPQPNNTTYNGQLATFTQFSSFPRIDMDSDTAAFRGQSQPVWTYTLPDGTETRSGSAGIFTNPTSSLITGVGLLGAVPEYSYFQVPGAPAGTRFDVFPGSPAITGHSIVAFKGNYTEGTTSKTGVYYRDTVTAGGQEPVILVANSDTVIPNQPSGGTVLFGSTAPPSAANGMMVFAGYDNEDNPTLGGIYAAPLVPSTTLQTIVSIGDPVPGETGNATFNRFGEGLAFDGRFIAFWGAWGNQTKTLHLLCSTDGNKDIVAACNQMYPNGYDAIEPINQGVFVYDLSTNQLNAVAKTTSEFDDFVYWVFSGRPPGVGGSSDESSEPPRWRSSSFIAVTDRGQGNYQVAFKAGTTSSDGIYLAQGPASAPIQTVIDTAMPGAYIDTQAPTGSTISTVGIERESLRGGWLVVTSSMLNAATTESGAGVYATAVALQ